MGILLAATSLLSGSVSVQLKKFQLGAQEEKWKSEVVVSPCKEGIITVKGKFNHTMTCNASGVSVPENRLPRRDRNYKLYVVYFINCKVNDQYGSWMEEQLRYVPQDAFLKIVAVSSECKEETTLYDHYRTLLGNRNSNFTTVLECHDEADDKPTFEYYGIHAMWEIGQMNPHQNSIVFYFHSKGMTHWKNYQEYKQVDPFHPFLTEMTLGQVDRVIDAFDVFPEVNKAGASGYKSGWVWYNFMFARGSYLKNVEVPILTERRHYYEDWLGRIHGPVQGVHPKNAIEGQHPGFLENQCDCYNLLIHDDMISRGWIAKDDPNPLFSNIFNVGTHYVPALNKWESCEKS